MGINEEEWCSERLLEYQSTNHPTYLASLPHQSKASRFTVTPQNWLSALSKLALSSGSQTLAQDNELKGPDIFCHWERHKNVHSPSALRGKKLHFPYGFRRPQSSSIPKTMEITNILITSSIAHIGGESGKMKER